jgi:hypothetical protein
MIVCPGEGDDGALEAAADNLEAELAVRLTEPLGDKDRLAVKTAITKALFAGSRISTGILAKGLEAQGVELKMNDLLRTLTSGPLATATIRPVR